MNDVHVAVIGAGLAGLTTARRLRAAGVEVRVLEAQSEVGGRTRSQAVDGGIREFGAQWISTTDHHVQKLVKELGLDLVSADISGHTTRWRLPGVDVCSRLPPARTTIGLMSVAAQLAMLSRGVSPDKPWTNRRATRLDATSAGEWFDGTKGADTAKYLLEKSFGSLLGDAVDSMSLLQLLQFVRMEGGPLRMATGLFRWQVKQGNQTIARRMAADLADVLQLDAAVDRIWQGGRQVTIYFNNEVLHCDLAVVTVPPALLTQIDFDPPLTSSADWQEAIRTGGGTTVIAALPAGYRDCHRMVVGGEPLWTAWRCGDQARGFAPSPTAHSSEAELREDLASAFHLDPAELSAFQVVRWQGPHRTGPNILYPPGGLCVHGPDLTSPHGLVHFAGAERSTGGMEGAVASGESAARRALRALS